MNLIAAQENYTSLPLCGSRSPSVMYTIITNNEARRSDSE